MTNDRGEVQNQNAGLIREMREMLGNEDQTEILAFAELMAAYRGVDFKGLDPAKFVERLLKEMEETPPDPTEPDPVKYVDDLVKQFEEMLREDSKDPDSAVGVDELLKKFAETLPELPE